MIVEVIAAVSALAGVLFFTFRKGAGSFIASARADNKNIANPDDVHIVKSGDTLEKIARIYDVSVAELIKENGIDNPNHIRVGQVLSIPRGSSLIFDEPDDGAAIDDNIIDDVVEDVPEVPDFKEPVDADTGNTLVQTYTVKSGDYLGKIAKAHGVSVIDLADFNCIDNPNDIRVGQVLKIPVLIDDVKPPAEPIPPISAQPSTPKPKPIPDPTPDPMPKPNPSPQPQPVEDGYLKYTIKRGDYLSKIAKAHGVSMFELAKLNDIDNPNNISVGQILLIPNNKPVNNKPSKPNTPKPKPKPSKPSPAKPPKPPKPTKPTKPTKPSTPKPQPTPEPSPKPAPVDNKPIKYTIKRGDYLSKIARAHGVSIYELAKLNNINNPNNIRVGQVLLIPNKNKPVDNKPIDNKPVVKPKPPISSKPSKPAPSPKPTPTPKPVPIDDEHITYTVKAGDYLSKIAKAHGVRVFDLANLNGIDNPNDIKVGQVLIIPKKKGSQPSKPAKPVDNKPTKPIVKPKPTKPKPTIPEPPAKPSKPSDGDSDKGQTYIVKPGDYLSKIAKAFGVSVSELATINGIDNPNDIRVGQVLKIPTHNSGSTPNKPNKPSKPNKPNKPSKPISADKCAEKFHRVSRIILRHEGGYVDDPADAGGKTNKGIAWQTWKRFAKIDLGLEPTKENLKRLSDEQAEIIYRKRYWEPQGFCEIKNDRVGLMVYDWTITSGGAAKQVQRLLVNEFGQNISIDGAMGPQTIRALNNVANQSYLLSRITYIRKAYYHMLVERRPVNKRFIKGWINRVNDCLEVHI